MSVPVVVIGRNEGERLVRSLRALAGSGARIVYVDSGSTDGSVERAREAGAEVVELDPSLPFTAARARNAGFAALATCEPEAVQFVDGDSELAPGWLAAGAHHLEEHPDVAVVCGVLREREPERSRYHRLAAIEWAGEAGEIRTAGGNAMVRGRVFRELGGYDAAMLAGEDPELCVRVRRAGYRVVRIAEPMAVHDAGPLDFAGWWRRAVRDGHAYAEILQRQGRSPEPYWVRQLGSIVAWGGALPAGIVLGAAPTGGWSLLGLAGYGLLWARIYRSRRRAGSPPAEARDFAGFCVLGKLAGFLGVLRFGWKRLLRTR